MNEDINMLKEEIQEQSLAWEILKDYKRSNEILETALKKLIIVLCIVLLFWLITIGAFLYYISTTGYEEDYREQTISNIENTEDLNIINGDTYGDSKASKKN